MLFRPAHLRDRFVGGVANQHVREAKAVVAGKLGTVRSCELLAHERDQPAREEIALGVGRRAATVPR